MYVPVFFISTVVAVAKAPKFRDEPIKHVNVGGMKDLTCHTEAPDAKVSWQFCASASGSYNRRCHEDEFSPVNTDPDFHYQLYFYQNYSNLLIYNVGLEQAGEYRMVEQDSKDVFRVVICQYLLVVHSSKADDKNSQTEHKQGAGKDEQALERYANTTAYLDSIMSYMKQLPDEIVSQIAKDNTWIRDILKAILVIAVIHSFFSIAKFIIRVIWSYREKIESFCRRRVYSNNEENRELRNNEIDLGNAYIGIPVADDEEIELVAVKGELGSQTDNISDQARFASDVEGLHGIRRQNQNPMNPLEGVHQPIL